MAVVAESKQNENNMDKARRGESRTGGIKRSIRNTKIISLKQTGRNTGDFRREINKFT
jgi:hypothetical protein